MSTLKWFGLAGALMLAGGCGGDDEAIPDASASIDAAQTVDAAPPPDAADPAVRGKYLVDHVALCIDCHTPHNPDGSLDMDNYLAGVECFVDIDPGDTNVGCLHSRNLTNDATGLLNRTDAQIKEMFTNGLRPNGDALIPVMPYWSYHNMTDDDMNAIVAYLRTVPAIVHAVPANQAPWTLPPAPAMPIPVASIPEPATTATNYESAMRGRYLAAMAGVCMECHTPELDPMTSPPRPMDISKPFAGGRSFPGLPMPPFDTGVSHSSNLTQHATGLEAWTAADVEKVLKQGLDKDGGVICPPMPAGAMAAYGGLADADVTDIANYIMTLPGIDNTISGTCSIAAQ